MAEKMPDYKVRYRTRRGYTPEAQGYTTWNEYQVVMGRKVISRHDTQEQADRAISALKEAQS